MPSVAGRRQCYCWVVPGKCWYSVLNLIFQSVLRHPSAAFFSRACFWCALTGLLSFLRVIYELITSSTYDVYMNVVFSQQCNCSSSLLLGAFGLISLRPTVIFMVDEKSKQIETGPAGHPLEFRACKIGQFHQTPLENWGLRMMGAADRKIYLSVSFSILIINYDNKGSRSWFDNCIIHSQVNAKCCRTKAANAVLIKVVKCWCSVLNHHNSQPQS